MKCPYCDNEMKLGYIQCRDGVQWTLKKQLVAALSVFGKECTSLANGAADNSNVVYAYKCDSCKKVIIDYSNREV
ncbi:PF20097 family protein [Dysosmobacter sp.]